MNLDRTFKCIWGRKKVQGLSRETIQREEARKKEISEKLTEANERKGKSSGVDAK